MMGRGVGGWIEICMCVYDIDQIVLPICYLWGFSFFGTRLYEKL